MEPHPKKWCKSGRLCGENMANGTDQEKNARSGEMNGTAMSEPFKTESAGGNGGDQARSRRGIRLDGASRGFF